MELTDNDRQLIKSWGYTPCNVAQIAHVVFFTKYEYCKLHCDEKHNVTCGEKEPITEAKALQVLGREQFLQGLCRSAFHWTASCENKNSEMVCFDSSSYFKN